MQAIEMRTKRLDDITEEEEGEDWCFFCHDGGSLRECDFPNCGKAYHHKCVGEKRSFLRSEEYWKCARHSCSKCSGRPTVSCYTCPKAVCDQCIDAAEFAPVRGENGFCKECMEFVLLIKKRGNLEDLDKKQIHLKEYYEIIKKQEGLTLDELQSAKVRWKSQKRRKSRSSLYDIGENKRQKGLQGIKLETKNTYLHKEVERNTAISFASLVPENVRLIYLTRSLVQKLLKQPESFEDKVKGTFVRVGLSSNNMSKRKADQVVQVTGITKISSDEDNLEIKLQASKIPHDISIDMISDADFSEKACEDLRQQVDVGLIKMPTVEELELKARTLHEDMVDDLIARELRKLQPKMDLANEKGWKREYYECSRRKKQLESPEERLRKINNLPVVIAEIPSEGIMNDRKGNRCPSESIPTKVGEYASNCDNLSEDSSSVFINNVAAGNKTTLDERPMLKNVMAGKKQIEGSPKFISSKKGKLRITTSGRSLFKRLPGASSAAQEHAREKVNCTVVDKARPPVPQAIDAEANMDQQLPLLETKQNNDMQDKGENSKKKPIEQSVELFSKQTNKEQQPRCSMPPQSLECRSHDLNPAMEQQLNHECCFRRELDILTLSYFTSHKSITMLEDELKRIKLKMEEDARENAMKMTSLEEKLDQTLEHPVKKLGGACVQSAKAITSYKKSQVSKEDVMKFLDPIYRASWTEALEEVKAEHLPDLDLSRFPMYDPEAREKVDLVLKKLCQSSIEFDHVVSQEAKENDWSKPNPDRRHLSPQGQEVEGTFNDNKVLEISARISLEALENCCKGNPVGEKKVDLLLKKICQSSVQVDHADSREATDKDCSKPNPEQQHLTPQVQEVERTVDGHRPRLHFFNK